MNQHSEGRPSVSRKSVIIKAFVTSTDPCPKYNGLSLPPETMYKIAESIREKRTTLGIEHDRKHNLPYRVLKSEVRETDIGSLGVWVELEMDQEHWEKAENKQAFSITLHQVFHLPDPEDKKPKITIAIDPACIDAKTSKEVIEELESCFAVEAHHLLQYSDLSPIASIVVTVALATQAVGSLIAEAICSAVKKLIATKNKNDENQEVMALIQKGDTKIFVKTGDPHIKEAIAELIRCEGQIQKTATHKQIGNPNNRRKNPQRKKRN